MRNPLTFLVVCFSFLIAGANAADLTESYQESTRLMAEGKYLEAIPHAKSAYDASVTKYGRLHKTTTTLAMNLGTITLFAGHLKDARALLRRALTATETVHGEDSINTVDPKIRLAQSLATLDPKDAKWQIAKNMSEALELYESAVDLALSQIGSESVAAIEIEAAMVFARSAQGAENGLTLAERAANRLKNPNSQNVEGAARANLWIGILSNRLNKPEQAQRALERALQIDGLEKVSLKTKRDIHVELVRHFEAQDERAKATPHIQAISALTPVSGAPIARISPLYWTEPDWAAVTRLPAKEQKMQVEFGIDSEGFVVNPRVLSPIGDSIDAVVLSSLQEWRYALPNTDGTINALESVRYEFTIPSRSNRRQFGTAISGLDPIRGVSDSAPIGDVGVGTMRSGG